MLGSEYNWLVSFTRVANGAPKISLARTGLFTLAVAVFCLFCVALQAEPLHRELLREASVAAKANDTAQFIAKLEAARALRPDYPRILINLARAYTAAGRTDDAIAQLRELDAMGLQLDLASDPAFSALGQYPEFAVLVKKLATSQSPPTQNETKWSVPDVGGIIEGIAINPATREVFFSDVHHRCIWSRAGSDANAAPRKFSSDSDNLPSVFALKCDPITKTLWASCSALPEMKGYTSADRGQGGLAEYDLNTRQLRSFHSLPADGREHVLGDFILAPDGSIYVSDSTSPVIWRLPPAGTQLEKWLEHADFVSLQGIASTPDGKSLHVADYANGIWRVDLATQSVTLLKPPAHRTLFGIDGIYAVPGGLVAVQNGLNPQRIVRLTLGPDGQPVTADALLWGRPAMNDLSLGQVVDGRLEFIGNSGWSLYEKPDATPPVRTLSLFSVPL